jgi:hypothetical protein
MPEQLSLPGLQTTAERFEPDPARRGRPQYYKLFFGLFPSPAEAQRLADSADALRLQHGLTVSVQPRHLAGCRCAEVVGAQLRPTKDHRSIHW